MRPNRIITLLLTLVVWQAAAKSLRKPDIHLANNAVMTTWQDNLGRMWFGTYDGLYLFDGEDTYTYRSNTRQPNFISSNIVDKLFSAGSEHMWVVTSVGLDLFSLRKGEVVAKYAGYNETDRFACDKDGHTLLLNKEGELHYYNPESGRFSKIDHVDLAPQNVCLIVVEADKTFQFIQNDGTIVRCAFDASGKAMISKEEMLIRHRIVKAIGTEQASYLVDSTGQLWQYTPRQTCSVIADLKKLTPYGNWHTLHTVARLDDGLYVGLLQGGLLRMAENGAWSCITGDYRIFSLWQDRFRQILWIGTDGYGAYMYCDSKRHIQGIRSENMPVNSRKPIRAIYVDSRNDLWVGTKGNGVFRIRNYEELSDKEIPASRVDHFSTSNGLSSIDVYSIVPARNRDRLWIIGNLGLGYYSYRENRMHSLSYRTGNELALKGYDFCEIDDSTAYITTSLGLVRITLETVGAPAIRDMRVIGFKKDHVSCSDVLPLMRESDSTLLVGARGGCGVIRFNTITEGYELLAIDNLNVALGDVLNVFKSREGTLYCGASSGLMAISGEGKATVLDCYDGMSNDMVHSVQEDLSGYIWLGTTRGLTCYDPKQNFFFNYSSPSRLPVIEFSDNTCWRHPVTGRLFFGGVDGLVWFDPDNVMYGGEGDYRPTIRFTELVTSDNKRTALYDDGSLPPIRIRPSISMFTLSFSAGDYIDEKDYEYYSLLKGYDKKWQPLQGRNKVTCANVPHGEYTLCISYRSNASDQGTDVYTVEIIVLPPWWATTLAWVVYAILAICTIVFSVWLVRRRIRNQHIRMVRRLKYEQQEKLYETRQNFFVNISHELCTPLTLINGVNSHFQELARRDPQLSKYTEVLDDNIANLNELIQEILDFRKIEEQKPGGGVKTSAVNIAALFERVLNQFSKAFERDRIDVSCQIADPLLWESNAGHLNKIVTNLISNAAKYTKKRGEIRISALVEQNALVIKVYNTGQGIPLEKQGLIFDRYATLDKMDTNMYFHSASRHGLGLFIAQSLARMLGGGITVRSTPGEFTEFRVELPMIAPAPDAKADSPEKPAAETSAEERAPGEKALADGMVKDKKPVIFVVDDNPDIVWLIRTELEQQFNVVGCNSAREALRQTRNITPDLIITDIVMPEMDGYDLIREICNNKYTSRIPIIVVSAKITDREQAKGLDQGADAYLTKPFSMVVLRSTINRLFEQRTRLKEYYTSPESAFVISDGQPIHQNDQEFMDRLMSIISANITNDELNPEFVAEQLSISPRNLYNKVKKISGHTPGELIKNHRFALAGRLVISTRLTIQEIMYEVGISSKSYFNREFFKEFGMSPSAYRNR
ncbi:hybrid sensor histidine kinase/response regulator [Bacteroidia bacterium]|nr:hybrid sensor histidine kinase/response regulator [Bacteroidia bacterium]